VLSCAFDEGWFWYIPLSDTLTSVGAVVSRDAAKQLQEGHEQAFYRFLDSCPLIKEYLAPAKRVAEGSYGEFRVRKDFSYCNTRFWQPGIALVGDAACFVDPVFSSGVHLATYAALLVARSVNTCLAGTISESACFAEFENRYRREFGNFYQFLLSFYDMHQGPESYFWTARKILDTEESANEAFVRLVAGVSSGEELFNSSEYFKVRVGLGDWFQELMSNRTIKAGKPLQFDKSRFDPSEFMKGFAGEIVQLQTQALFGEHRPEEKPLGRGGLIPSRQGFHWEYPPDAPP
jgi:halogenation protein CepH